ncbi:MlaA family lipoprotein [Alteromonas pelagimontana]|nr:VacJ family lipoprotein [Alteromonas pelagimontana]
MQAFKQIVIILAVGVIAGCATPQESEEQATQSNQTKEERQQPNQNVEQLSAGKSVTVETSQGKISVEPTVVAVTDAQGSSDVATGDFYYDPWEGFNRSVFGFNNYLYQYVLIPASNGYQYVVPVVVRDKIGNAFDNIREPLNLVNNLFAGEVDEAGVNLGRFVINSTVGILGLFDPATNWFEMEPKKQTIADTLQRYDVQSGPYLVLPLLGPSDTRGAFSTVTEGFIHPINQFFEPPESYQLRTADGFDDFSNQSDTYQQLYQQAEDPYIYFRNQYIQGQRRDELFQYNNEQQQDEK